MQGHESIKEKKNKRWEESTKCTLINYKHILVRM